MRDLCRPSFEGLCRWRRGPPLSPPQQLLAPEALSALDTIPCRANTHIITTSRSCPFGESGMKTRPRYPKLTGVAGTERPARASAR